MKTKNKRKPVYLAECSSCKAPIYPKKCELQGDFQNPRLVGVCPQCKGEVSTFRYLDVSGTSLPNDHTFWFSFAEGEKKGDEPPPVDDLLRRLQGLADVEVLDHGNRYVAVRDHTDYEGHIPEYVGLKAFALWFLKQDLTGRWTFQSRREIPASPC